MSQQPWWRPAVAEFLGVFTLVFVGAGSIVSLNHFTGGTDEARGAVLLGVALAHGLALATMITALGHISGGHFNPAVTVAALFTRRLAPPVGAAYLAFQFLGGAVGAYLLVAALPADWWQAVALGTPAVGAGLDNAKAVLVEAVLTFFLVLVVFGVGMDERNASRPLAGLAIGLTVTLDILMGGPLTGAAMNPARAFGPALASQTWTNHYVWWVGPLLGGIIAGLVYDLAFVEERVRPSRIPRAEAPRPPEVPEEPPTEPAG